jgi:hypothetical protein
MKTLVLCGALLLALTAATFSAAVTYTMGYTPPGGVTVVPSGTSYTTGGATFAYNGFNTADYSQLYWGVNYVANVAQSDNTNPGNMTFYSYTPSTGVIAFVSTQNWVFQNTITTGTVSTATQLIVQVQPYNGSNVGLLGSGFLNGDTTTKGALGIGGEATDPLYQITSGGAYQGWFEFETWDGTPGGIGSGTDLLDYYTANNGGNPTTVFDTSVDFEFWWSVVKTTAKTVQVGTCRTRVPSYSTIGSAIEAVPSGAVIEICPGTYAEQLTINAPVTLEGVPYGAEQQVLITVPNSGLAQNGTGPVSSFPIYGQILVQDAEPVNISGVTVDGSNSNCPSGAIAGIVYLSTAAASSGKVSASAIRNVGNGCNTPAMVGIYAENGSGSAATLTVQSNSIHSISGLGIGFGPNQGGTISSNSISQVSSGLSFQSAGPNVKATSNSISGAQNAISLSSANTVTVQSNVISDTSGTAISLNDSSGTGNNITKNTINEANCGISDSNAGSDVFLPNTITNASASTCN